MIAEGAHTPATEGQAVAAAVEADLGSVYQQCVTIRLAGDAPMLPRENENVKHRT